MNIKILGSSNNRKHYIFFFQFLRRICGIMYVTRPFSWYKKSPADLSLPPPEGPNSGILVIQDEEPKFCLNLFKSDMIQDLPLPQNKSLELYYAQGFYPSRELHFFKVLFIPVLNLPLSSNQYYAIYPYGKDRGEGYTSSKVDEIDMDPACCFSSCPNDVLPQRFDPQNIYQQYQIDIHKKLVNISGGFAAKSMAKDGCPPDALSRRGWKLTCSTASEFELVDAQGLDTALRSQLPGFDFPLMNVVVGKWYCPFMFVKEMRPLKSMYYEMTLEQRWKQIFVIESSKEHGIGNAVNVDVVMQSEVVVVVVGGRERECDEKIVDDGVMWFKSVSNLGEETRVGLSLAIVERMKWEQERVGWVGGDEAGDVRVERVEKYGGMGQWKKFACFVLVEKFMLKRMNGSLLINHEFKHTHKIKCKWE
ncbi:uncharacterized protein LOC126791408 [Argentina anserina]|uniref:uncharacterized protein LOC126791408 n=1 Tax=Argentina anserina TaxID=57926 RepID=UPI002176384D|nr:uncharacterized protein LOC126791408 [Potentilla anserina]